MKKKTPEHKPNFVFLFLIRNISKVRNTNLDTSFFSGVGANKKNNENLNLIIKKNCSI